MHRGFIPSAPWEKQMPTESPTPPLGPKAHMCQGAAPTASQTPRHASAQGDVVGEVGNVWVEVAGSLAFTGAPSAKAKGHHSRVGAISTQSTNNEFMQSK